MSLSNLHEINSTKSELSTNQENEEGKCSPQQSLWSKKSKFVSTNYTRSLDSTPSISALLGLVLIEELTKSSISALF